LLFIEVPTFKVNHFDEVTNATNYIEMFLKLFVQSLFISIARIVDVVIENQEILFLTQERLYKRIIFIYHNNTPFLS